MTSLDAENGLSVIVPAHRTGARIFRLLDSIAKQESAPPFEVIVVANPPDPRLQRVLQKEYPWVSYRESEEVGANQARNRGIRSARGQVLLFLDDDCELDRPTFLCEHFQAHLRFPELSALGGPYKTRARARSFFRPWAETYSRIQENWLKGGQKEGQTAYLLGGNCSFKASVLREHQFDPRMRFGGTETELFLRLRSLGYRFGYFPDLSLVHNSAPTLRALLRKSFWQGMGSGYIKEKMGRYSYAEFHESQKASWPERLFSVGFVAGEKFFEDTSCLNVSAFHLWRALSREALRRVRAVPFNRFFTEAYCCITAVLEREEARKKGKAP